MHGEVLVWKKSIINIFYIWQVTVTLTFELWTQSFTLDTQSYLDEQICHSISKSFHVCRSYGTDKVYHQHFWTLTSDCVLDLWARDLGLARDTQSYLEKRICQIISKSFNARKGYGLDKVYHQHFLTLTNHSDLDLWAIDLGLTLNNISHLDK